MSKLQVTVKCPLCCGKLVMAFGMECNGRTYDRELPCPCCHGEGKVQVLVSLKTASPTVPATEDK